MSGILDHLRPWADERAADLAVRAIYLEVTDGPVDRDKRSAWVDVDSPTRSVRLVVWDSGEATLSVGDLATGAVIADEQLEITTRFGLEEALSSAVAWAEV